MGAIMGVIFEVPLLQQEYEKKIKFKSYTMFTPFTTEARFYVLNAIAFSTKTVLRSTFLSQ